MFPGSFGFNSIFMGS
jgi:hypothetical protein